MKVLKITTLAYFVLLFASIIILFNIGFAINGLLQAIPLSENFSVEFALLQKKAGLYGIVLFVLLLLVSLVLYYLSKKRSYLILSNLVYLALILYVFVTANQKYFLVQNINYSEKSEYWITVFMGIFYIIGAILVSAISYITMRNFTKRINNTLNKI